MIHAKPILPASARFALRALLLMSLVLVTTCLVIAGSASAKSQKSSSSHGTLTLRTKFTRFGGGGLVGSGRYVLVYGNNKGVLVDTGTGHRTTISESGCFNPIIGGSSIVFGCRQGIGNSSYELYSITTGQSRPLVLNPAIIPSGCSDDVTACVNAIAVGADWIAFTPACQEHCNAEPTLFQNLATGAVASPAGPSGRPTMVDLDSPKLFRSACALARTNFVASVDGRFAIVTGGGTYLEDCGSKLHEFLTYTLYPGFGGAPPSNSHAIVWESAPLRLSGIFLPSRQRFTIPVPDKVDPAPGMYVNGDQYSLALTAHTLYVENRHRVDHADPFSAATG